MSKSKFVKIKNFDFFFIRQDPPFDMSYLTNCYLLEIHSQFNNKPFFINNPGGIKNFTEKIFPMYFKEYMPDTIITSSENSFLSMLKKHGSVVLKPLYLKGGEGIRKVNNDHKDSVKTFNETLVKYKTPLVVQEFLSKVYLGDKRVIILDGLTLGAVNRIPKKGEFKANLHLGGEAKKTILTKKEKEICFNLKSILRKNRLLFVGIDLINEKLTEINVTSPTGITQINNLYQTNLSDLIWKRIKKKYRIY